MNLMYLLRFIVKEFFLLGPFKFAINGEKVRVK